MPFVCCQQQYKLVCKECSQVLSELTFILTNHILYLQTAPAEVQSCFSLFLLINNIHQHKFTAFPIFILSVVHLILAPLMSEGPLIQYSTSFLCIFRYRAFTSSLCPFRHILVFIELNVKETSVALYISSLPAAYHQKRMLYWLELEKTTLEQLSNTWGTLPFDACCHVALEVIGVGSHYVCDAVFPSCSWRSLVRKGEGSSWTVLDIACRTVPCSETLSYVFQVTNFTV